MTRILPLIPLMLWLTWADAGTRGRPPEEAAGHDWMAFLWLVNGMLAIVAVMALWARGLLRTHRHSLHRLPTRAFHHGMLAARLLVVAWFGVSLYLLGWGQLIDGLLAPLGPWNVRLPGLVAGTWPVLLGWVGLWWAAYPVERATREQNLLYEIDSGITPRAPPSLSQTLASNFRMQVLFMVAPVLAVGAIRDGVAVGLHLASLPLTDGVEAILFLASVALVFVASPELLVRVLRARPLAPSPLRSRLEAMAARLNLRYRDILIWHTSHGIGNAAVMGLIPRFRYILLTDLLIETLDDRQIEAVFAHEAGHVKHRHLLWYVVFFAIFLLTLSGPAETVYRALFDLLGLPRPAFANVLVAVGVMTAYLVLFGMLARLFEKQADVFAARSMQSLEVPIEENPRPLSTPVGIAGAESFVSALSRVAEINQLPTKRPPRPRNLLAAGAGQILDSAINFMHPSIPDRVDHLRDIAAQETGTARFDKKVVLVMFGMLSALAALAAWVAIETFR